METSQALGTPKIYQDLGVSRIINAAGKMTYLGSSTVAAQVAEAMKQAGQAPVDMEVLKQKLSDKIAALTRSHGGYITASAASGIVVSIAATLTGTDLHRIESLPQVLGHKQEVIIQKGHGVHYGASILQTIRMSGATPVEIGTVNLTEAHQLEGSISERTAATLYIVSHHTVQNGMLPLEEVIEMSHRHQVPVIVDAAAEVDLQKYTRTGADLVVYSGHKAFGAPTSGFVCGRLPYIVACSMQEKGIARAMKVGKETMAALVRALELSQEQDQTQEQDRWDAMLAALQDTLKEIDGVKTYASNDATRPIPRLVLEVTATAGFTAKELISYLEAGNPSIRTRNHKAAQGIVQFDPRELKEGDMPLIREKVEEFLSSRDHNSTT